MRAARWAVVVAAVSLVAAIAAVAYAAGRSRAVPVADVVKARQFELVDSAGHTRGMLSTWGGTGHSVATFAIMDEKGNGTVELSVEADADQGRTAWVRLAGGRGAARTQIELTAGKSEPQGVMVRVGPGTERMPGQAKVIWQAP
jgi:hypothetical protein